MVKEMEELAWALVASPVPPSKEEIAEKNNDWAHKLDQRRFTCDECANKQKEIDGLVLELCDAVDDFSKET